MEAIDRRTAVAVGSYDFVGGGLVLRTADGGTNWQDVTPAGQGFRDVFFINASTGWIVGAGIYKTTDGGLHWTKEYGTDATEFDAISFSDPLHGWATGYNNLVLHTANGGRSWVAQDVGAPPVTAITGVTAIDAKKAWIAGWYGFVAVTTDRGRSWRQEQIRGTGEVSFEDALFVDASRWMGRGKHRHLETHVAGTTCPEHRTATAAAGRKPIRAANLGDPMSNKRTRERHLAKQAARRKAVRQRHARQRAAAIVVAVILVLFAGYLVWSAFLKGNGTPRRRPAAAAPSRRRAARPSPPRRGRRRRPTRSRRRTP